MSAFIDAGRKVFYSLPAPARAALETYKNDFAVWRASQNRKEAVAQSRLAYEREIETKVFPIVDKIHARAVELKGDKILIDCGFNQGKILEAMIKRLPEFKNVYGFEINREYFADRARKLKEEYPQIVSLDFAAVASHNGTIGFQIAGEHRRHWRPAESTSIVSGFNDASPRHGDAQVVPCLHFSPWLQETFVRHIKKDGTTPYIALKLDIEGSEVEVLEEMLHDGSIYLIRELMVEFHSQCFQGEALEKYLAKEKDIRADLNDLSRDGFCRVHEWTI